MREELSELIRFESADPRVVGVEVTEVVVAADLRKADVLVTLPGEAELRMAALAGLDAAKGYLRVQLMHRMDLHRMPELRFRASSEVAGGQDIGRLLRRARRGRPTIEKQKHEE
jgi:ribosome-binding factor A